MLFKKLRFISQWLAEMWVFYASISLGLTIPKSSGQALPYLIWDSAEKSPDLYYATLLANSEDPYNERVGGYLNQIEVVYLRLPYDKKKRINLLQIYKKLDADMAKEAYLSCSAYTSQVDPAGVHCYLTLPTRNLLENVTFFRHNRTLVWVSDKCYRWGK